MNIIFFWNNFLLLSDGRWDSENCLSSSVAPDTVCAPECNDGYYSSEAILFTCIQDIVTLDNVWDPQDAPLCVPGCWALSVVACKAFTL